MALAGTAILDDEFHEKPQFEEAKVLEEIPNALKSGSHANSGVFQ